MEDCFQGADLAESGTLIFPTFFLTVVWILVVMAGSPAVVLDNHVTLETDTTQALTGPPPALFQWERKIKFILLNYSCFSFLQCASILNPDTANMCLIHYSFNIFGGLVNISIFYISLIFLFYKFIH